jgi:hypothetical protein
LIVRVRLRCLKGLPGPPASRRLIRPKLLTENADGAYVS